MPFTWIVVLLLWALFTKNVFYKRRAFLAGIFLLLLFSNRIVFDETMRAWEVPAVAEPVQGIYDGIIVLGGVSVYDEELNRTQFSHGNDRLMQGLLLLKKNTAPQLIFTGGSGSILHPEFREAVWIRQTVQRLGIPDSQLVFEDSSRNTYENAVATKARLGDVTNKRFLLITSGFHMRRSLACFTKAGMNVTPYSADRYSGGPRRVELSMLLPDAEILQSWNQIFHEWFGCIMYKLSGYI